MIEFQHQTSIFSDIISSDNRENILLNNMNIEYCMHNLHDLNPLRNSGYWKLNVAQIHPGPLCKFRRALVQILTKIGCLKFKHTKHYCAFNPLEAQQTLVPTFCNKKQF